MILIVPETGSRTVAHRSFFPQKKTTTDDEETWFEHDDHAIEIRDADADDADADGYGAISAAAGGDMPAFAAASSVS